MNLEDKLQLIEQTLHKGQLHQGLKMLEDLSIDYPHHHNIASMLGECYLAVGQPNKAIKALKWAMKIATSKTKSVRARCSVPQQTSSPHQDNEEEYVIFKLKADFQKNSPPDFWFEHYLLGCAYGRCMKFKSAMKHLNLADQMNPENTEIIRNIGWINCLQEKKVLGRRFLEKAIALDPNNALAYNDLGASYMFDNKFEHAQKWINKALELDPEDEFIIKTAEKLEELRAYQTIFKK